MGSIILAGVILKLGGYGIIFFGCLCGWSLVRRRIQVFSLLGGGLVGMLCLRQMDIKVLIAYSSVRHIRIVIRGLIRKTRFGLKGGIIIIIAHGVVSTGLFIRANLIYK